MKYRDKLNDNTISFPMNCMPPTNTMSSPYDVKHDDTTLLQPASVMKDAINSSLRLTFWYFPLQHLVP